MSRLLAKIDTFDALLRFKKDIVRVYTHTISRMHSPRIQKEHVAAVAHPKVPFIDTVEEIIKPKSSVSKYPNADTLVDDQEHKTMMIKKRKLLEKIIYDAL